MSDLQSRILECAVDQFLDKGLKGLSMRLMAEKLGVSATAIYRHYRNKEELVHKVVEEAFKVFASYLFGSLSGANPEERLRMGGEAYLNFALEQSKYYEVIFMYPEQLGSEDLPDALRQKGAATFQILLDRVQECMESGHLKKDEPRIVAMSIWAHCHGLVSLYFAKKMPLDETGFRKVYHESLERIFAGLRF